jgi:hypothetical protein
VRAVLAVCAVVAMRAVLACGGGMHMHAAVVVCGHHDRVRGGQGAERREHASSDKTHASSDEVNPHHG